MVSSKIKVVNRCSWSGENSLMIKYHDEEWGVPVYDDRKLFEFLVLESAQAGLSWQTILNKRENYRKAFSGFDVKKIARYGSQDIKRLILDSGIVRNRLKIASVIQNTKMFLNIQKEFGSFNKYIWKFIDGKIINNKIKSQKDIPVASNESRNMSKDLLKRGFKFIGPTICYAFMQAVGMVNDHEIKCFRYNVVIGIPKIKS